MRIYLSRLNFIFVLNLLFAATRIFGAVGTAFTYQGRLVDNGVVGNGTYDFRFQLFTAASSGGTVGAAVTNQDIRVTEGYFTVDLDFGPNAFTGDSRWLEVAVRPGTNTGSFTALSPRHAINPTPYSLYATTAGSLPWTAITGVPPGLADGIDNDTTYSAGAGLALNGTVFSIAPFSLVNSMIASNQVVKSLNGLRDDVALLDGDNVHIQTTNGNLQISAIDVWKTRGNSGATSSNFLGTLDNQPLEFRVNNARALLLEPHPSGPNLIGGSADNMVVSNVFGAVISGGSGNRVTDPHGTVGGGLGNQAGNADDNFFIGRYTTVGGGRANTAAGEESTVAGGQSNMAGGELATVSGGGYNKAGGYASTIAGGGGYNNTLDRQVPNQVLPAAFWGVVGGGSDNIVTNEYGAIAGGGSNRSAGQYSTVGGGLGNAALGDYAAVPGGQRNSALGLGSFAAGTRARARFPGTFTWADASNPAVDFNATTDNEFAVRAAGGVRFVTAIDGAGGPTAGVTLAGGGGSWSTLSDRNAKENFAELNCRSVLESLAALPVETWNYKTQDPSIRHIGVMAQDFAAAFNVGEDNRHINTGDADGVALAAIKGLYELVREKDADLEKKNNEIQNLNQRLAVLEKIVATLSRTK